MYLPNKITNVLAKIEKSYEVKYTNGKITSIYINEKDIKIEASSKGYCLNLKGGPIFLNDIKSLEPLLIKMGVIKAKKVKNKEVKNIKDNLVELFSKKKNTFSVEYINSKVISIKIYNPNLSIKKTGVGYAMIVNNESISIDSVNSLKKLLIKMNLIEKEKSTNKKSKDNILFEQLTMNLDEIQK
ncbi:hypothetical protein H8891_03610 [Paeniclostridium sp. NSJ-45]|uniref:Uncharacterized protein n=1 Tax=Paeniclostridium hominis TaxID=2764329 RepID=A0ABR7K187_9FIRM|nr:MULTISPECIES: hypothetical protein [Paeniclostridium]MBC6002878.1 hypothetical protein [Paeniclostridium hominis]